MTLIAPGSTVGIIGGGQLGRMAAMAAARLGYDCVILTPEADSPASRVARQTVVAPYDDPEALQVFADAVDVVTFEFENVPAEAVAWLAVRRPVRPSWTVLETAQDRILEKTFLNRVGIETAPWRPVLGPDDLRVALDDLGTPAVLKTTRLGYDGKGQVRLEAGADCGAVWDSLGADAAILEGFVDFDMEASVIVARGPDGAVATFDAVQNEHVNHILDTTTVPAPLPEPVRAAARDLARRAAEALDLVGLLAVELFVTRDGRLLANEMAPRPHNSGHWSLDGAVTDQFEQFIRAVCGLPLGATDLIGRRARMKNLIGDAASSWEAILADPTAHLHLYGKRAARAGRKMGHVTWLEPFDTP
ncbi:5-(carboxyamino)imidazole ribonucleotide synthase [Roseospira marina]|uniref:N5-carboxyaminoimidazole ribonucleotide synthase n=1 Tax=Roseospira marina TaxID=140057 RepID=A0A5M6IGY1_9PROT|nr:5-(carboxyamino)imidazole ribonucleotide synthase [Roseospira marina]KAA5607561.1 5-(carboxyamino)imidazole ribonucleotide synthase [Roseospira marina]MBB4312251.1 5-(carboxyamino)imidazole ribonucleotide synthase [Roseospira marina]MBB5085733.1 5-(carboxyamino)imidazole ribonucleotide synthase [Roseospira marina]